MDLVLAKDGIFPIIRDQRGNLLPDLPASGYPFAGTIQGEGKLSGIPSLFIRLAGCNLHCMWTDQDKNVSGCDTPYSSISLNGSYRLSITDILDTLQHNVSTIRHLVITGGEPLLQSEALAMLCRRIKERFSLHITIETNATLFSRDVAECTDLFSMSPKLASSVPQPPLDKKHDSLRLNVEAIQQFITYARENNRDFQLKFVYSSEADIAEIKGILSQLHAWKNDDILLMPLGSNSQQLQRNIHQTLKYCILNGWRYCDRLHISLFGDKAGV